MQVFTAQIIFGKVHEKITANLITMYFGKREKTIFFLYILTFYNVGNNGITWNFSNK